MMQEGCLFDLMEVPEDTLQRVLPKTSVKVIARLVSAYPRTIGRVFIEVLTPRMSPATLQFLKEEIQTCPIPSYSQIREAERELHKAFKQVA